MPFLADDVMTQPTPEEKELTAKEAQLAALEAELSQRELDLLTLQAELDSFSRQYFDRVGALYARVDDLHAQIAEAMAQENSGDASAATHAERLRAQARNSAEEAGIAEKREVRPPFQPTDELKRTYRHVAMLVHPDLSTDERERSLRTRVMAEANEAYANGDEARLLAILSEWQSRPDVITGKDIGARLVRVIRQIAQVRKRLQDIDLRMDAMRESDLHKLKSDVADAAARGRDMLSELERQLGKQIVTKELRLEELRN